MKVYEMVIADKDENKVESFFLGEFEATLKSLGDLIPYIDQIRKLGYFVSQINFLDMSMEEYVKIPAGYLSKQISEGVIVQ